MNNTPLVSVVMSTYNENLNWLRKAIESILNQSYGYFEFIIIIDNPDNKEIEDMLNDFSKKDNRIIIIKNYLNLGLVKSLNKGIEISKGEYIVRMDADDISEPNRIEKQIKFIIENPQYDLVGGNVSLIDDNDNVLLSEENIITTEETLREVLKYTNAMHHPTWIIKKKVFRDKNIKGYREVPLAEDYDMLLRLLLNNYKIINIKDVVLKYRLRQNGISISNSFNQSKISIYLRDHYKQALIKHDNYIDLDGIENLMNDNNYKAQYEKCEIFKKKAYSKGSRYGMISEFLCSFISIYHRRIFVDKLIYKLKIYLKLI